MNYNTVYVGMDVHKESFTLCSMTIEDEKASHYQKNRSRLQKGSEISGVSSYHLRRQC